MSLAKVDSLAFSIEEVKYPYLNKDKNPISGIESNNNNNNNNNIKTNKTESKSESDLFSSYNYKGNSIKHSVLSRYVIGNALKNKIESIDINNCSSGGEDSFFVSDLGQIYRQHIRWKLCLPRVTPFYAVKCNNNPIVLKLLASLGLGFDCASKSEIDKILSLSYPLKNFDNTNYQDAKVDPSRIIYAHPCKASSYIRYAQTKGVSKMVFDNADELYKCKKFFPEAELFLRIHTDDSKALCSLSIKYGVHLPDTLSMLRLAKDLGLNVVGVSFHVGSGATDPQSFVDAVKNARKVFDEAESVGYNLSTLDIGGGFVSENFEEVADVLSPALDENFPPSVKIIAEPGRFYVSSAFTIVANVIARKWVDKESSYMYYLNDGVYGNMNCIIFDHQIPKPRVLSYRGQFVYDFGNDSLPSLSSGSCSPIDLDSDEEISKINLSSNNNVGKNIISNENEGTCDYGDLDSSYYNETSRRCSLDLPSPLPVHCSIWGPTCDGIDCITKSCTIDYPVEVGDWMYFTDFGAYTLSAASTFNGFNTSCEIMYVCSDSGLASLFPVEDYTTRF